jgi:TPP-dependent 2-oxoacid decarboxylase
MIDIQETSIRMPNGRLIQDLCLADALGAFLRSSIPPKRETLFSFQWKSRQQTRVNSPVPGEALTMRGIVDVIQQLIKSNDTLIADTGDAWFNAAEISLPMGANFQIQLVYASLGWSLPAALGCQLARPDARTILMIGDGAFQMTAQELSTAIRSRANMIVFIFNNLGYQIEVSFIIRFKAIYSASRSLFFLSIFESKGSFTNVSLSFLHFSSLRFMMDPIITSPIGTMPSLPRPCVRPSTQEYATTRLRLQWTKT